MQVDEDTQTSGDESKTKQNVRKNHLNILLSESTPFWCRLHTLIMPFFPVVTRDIRSLASEEKIRQNASNAFVCEHECLLSPQLTFE